MKKFLILLLVMVLSVASLFAGDLKFVFGDLGQHPDILAGFFPSYLLLGAGYVAPELVEGSKTEVQLLVGDGYNQRLLWQDKDSGDVMYGTWDKDSALRFNVWQNDVSLRFLQGFGDSPVEGKDLLTLTATLNGKYEKYYDGSQFGPFDIKGTLDSVIGSSYTGTVYPELNGNSHEFLGLEFALALKLDAMEDTLHTNDGYWVKLDAKYGPYALNSALDGYADYFNLNFNAVAAKTLLNLGDSEGKSLVSLVLIDRANAAFATGKFVPSFIQGPVSLGRKVRGYNTYTYNTELTAVNNLDLRIAGPDAGINGIAPRANLFFDMGYGWGERFNTDDSESNFLCSTGLQMEMSFFDFIDLGWEVNYIFTGHKYTGGAFGNDHITTNFTFFLDF